MMRTRRRLRRSTIAGRRLNLRNALVPAILAALLLAPAPAIPTHATTLARVSLEQLAARADAVARVRCVRSESHWEAGSIWTVTTAEVVEQLGGNLPVKIQVRLPGGRVGHLTATVGGTPRFQPGDEAYLFLARVPAGGYTVAAWAEGTFRITRDARTRAETVTQESSAFAVFDAATRSFRAEGIRRMPVAEFRARVAAAIAHSGEKIR